MDISWLTDRQYESFKRAYPTMYCKRSSLHKSIVHTVFWVGWTTDPVRIRLDTLREHQRVFLHIHLCWQSIYEAVCFRHVLKWDIVDMYCFFVYPLVMNTCSSNQDVIDFYAFIAENADLLRSLTTQQQQAFLEDQCGWVNVVNSVHKITPAKLFANVVGEAK